MRKFVVLSLYFFCVKARVANELDSPLKLVSDIPDATVKDGLNITRVGFTEIYEVETTTEKGTSVPTDIKIDLPITIPSNLTQEEINEDDDNKIDVGEALLLTPLIKEGKLKEARKVSKVNPDLFFGLASHSGFLTVNEEYNSNLFFWYFPVPDKPASEAPWLIWLQGGPGASVMAGLFDEIGPVTVDANLELKYRKETWGKKYSLLFIENPVGTGYSFTNNKLGYAHHTNTSSAELYVALQQFLQVFPELREAPLFVAGESYAGKYVPGLAMEIHRHRDTHERINLQGLTIGNGFVEASIVGNYSRIAYHFGIIDDEGRLRIRQMEQQFMRLLDTNDSIAAKKQWQLTIYAIHLLAFQSQLYNFMKDDLGLLRYEALLRRPEIKRAIHVGNLPFVFSNATVNTEMAPDFLTNYTPLLEELLENYRVLMYSGQLDMMVPYVLTSESMRRWRWSGSEKFAAAERHPWKCGSEVSGFHKSGGNLTEVLVRGAGHMVPLDKPVAAQQLIEHFVEGLQLDGKFIVEYEDMFKSQKNEIIYL